MRHGATLRYTNLSRRLACAGHTVYYGVTGGSAAADSTEDRSIRSQHLDVLRREGCFRDCFELDAPSLPKLRRRAGKLLIHPAIKDRLLRSALAQYSSDFHALLAKLGVDLCIVSDRQSLFLVPTLLRNMPVIIDWCDSLSVYHRRELAVLFRTRQFSKIPFSLLSLFAENASETYYGRQAAANLVVSHADKRALDRLNGRADRNFVLLNGATPPSSQSGRPKRPNSLIFTGSMGFPPNYQAALWFIEKVFPLVLRLNPDVHLTIAGQEPIAALRAKAGPNIEVTGIVEDLTRLIAETQLYVAPLISGTGFRNKIVEALLSGTFVVGTPMAFEFLDDRVRSCLVSAADPKSFADEIVRYLANPAPFEPRLAEARELILREYTWDERAAQLESICCSVHGKAAEGSITSPKAG